MNSFQKKTTSRFNNNQYSGKDNENFSNFQKIHMNKVIPLKAPVRSNKSLTPEKMKSEKANNSSLYDNSIKAGSIKDGSIKERFYNDKKKY
jgi:hypothetical protein